MSEFTAKKRNADGQAEVRLRSISPAPTRTVSLGLPQFPAARPNSMRIISKSGQYTV
jgi:hypothetical protein